MFYNSFSKKIVVAETGYNFALRRGLHLLQISGEKSTVKLPRVTIFESAQKKLKLKLLLVVILILESKGL